MPEIAVDSPQGTVIFDVHSLQVFEGRLLLLSSDSVVPWALGGQAARQSSSDQRLEKREWGIMWGQFTRARPGSGVHPQARTHVRSDT